MILTPETRIHDLLTEYPHLLDFLAAYRPDFQKLKNPVLRSTVGRVATLATAAAMGNVPLPTLIADLERAIAAGPGGPASSAPAAGAGDKGKIETLKGIIRDLHAGVPMPEVKRRFAELVQDVDPAEIATMEQQLIREGMPESEVKRLCDVHTQVFQESLDQQPAADVPPGHPVHTFRLENRALEQAGADFLAALPAAGDSTAGVKPELRVAFERLAEVEKHYLRKEYQLFPFLEKHGFSGPSQVMWAIHDDVRRMLKQLRRALDEGNIAVLASLGPELERVIREMAYKEEKILLPVSLDLLSEREWAEIRGGEAEFGYALAMPAAGWEPRPATDAESGPEVSAGAGITLSLDTGQLELEQLNLLLRHLPLDSTFVDEHDVVRYYSEGPNRVFLRSPQVIGRKVQNCHPPKSLYIVKRILEAFKTGAKDTAEFWIRFQDRFIHIRYLALRDAEKHYRGCLEITQDCTAIRALTGERRLLDWDDSPEEEATL
jgi:DUF438 domain-containing protein